MTLPKPLEVADNRDKTWQQTKSENTRAAILEATLVCFYDLGYGATTTEKVAKRAGVSRGAMLHHFPSSPDILYLDTYLQSNSIQTLANKLVHFHLLE